MIVCKVQDDNGLSDTFRWEGGQLESATGDAVTVLEAACKAGETVRYPCGPHFTGLDILGDAGAVYLLAKVCFDRVTLVSGEIPGPPEVPEGTIV